MKDRPGKAPTTVVELLIEVPVLIGLVYVPLGVKRFLLNSDGTVKRTAAKFAPYSSP